MRRGLLLTVILLSLLVFAVSVNAAGVRYNISSNGLTAGDVIFFLESYANWSFSDLLNLRPDDLLFSMSVQNTTTESKTIYFKIRLLKDGQEWGWVKFDTFVLPENDTKTFKVTNDFDTGSNGGTVDWPRVVDSGAGSGVDAAALGQQILTSGGLPAGRYTFRFEFYEQGDLDNPIIRNTGFEITPVKDAKLISPQGETALASPTFSWDVPKVGYGATLTAEVRVYEGENEVFTWREALSQSYNAGARFSVSFPGFVMKAGKKYAWTLNLVDGHDRPAGIKATSDRVEFWLRNNAPRVSLELPTTVKSGIPTRLKARVDDAEDGDLPSASIQWKVAGRVIGTGAEIEHVFPREGNLQVECVAKDSAGAQGTARGTIRVDDNLPPRVTYSVLTAQPFEVGKALEIEATATDPEEEPVEITWLVDGQTFSGARLTYVLRNATTLINLVAVDATGQRAQINLLVQAITPPPAGTGDGSQGSGDGTGNGTSDGTGDGTNNGNGTGDGSNNGSGGESGISTVSLESDGQTDDGEQQPPAAALANVRGTVFYEIAGRRMSAQNGKQLPQGAKIFVERGSVMVVYLNGRVERVDAKDSPYTVK